MRGWRVDVAALGIQMSLKLRCLPWWRRDGTDKAEQPMAPLTHPVVVMERLLHPSRAALKREDCTILPDAGSKQ